MPKLPKIRRRSLLIIAAIVLVASVLTYASGILTPQSPLPSLVEGAYASYVGNTEIHGYPLFVYWNYGVLSFNKTHADLLVYIRFESPLLNDETNGTRTIEFANKGSDFISGNVVNSSLVELDIPDAGKRRCYLYVYEHGASVYVDEQILWPLRINYKTTSMSVQLDLFETDITGLSST